jgi:hypothetical protein
VSGASSEDGDEPMSSILSESFASGQPAERARETGTYHHDVVVRVGRYILGWIGRPARCMEIR